MFCRESGCEKSICHLCLVKSHKFHDVVDLEEQRKENYRSLVKDIEHMSYILTENKKNIQAVQEGLEKKYEKSMKILKLRKEEVIRKISEHMDKLGEKLREDKTDNDTQIQNDMETVEININMIEGLQDDMNEMATLEDIQIKREIVNNVCEEIKKRNTNKKGYAFMEYQTDQLSAETLEHICGKTTKRETTFTSLVGEFLASTIEEKRDRAFLQNPKLGFPKKAQFHQNTSVTKTMYQKNSILNYFKRSSLQFKD